MDIKKKIEDIPNAVWYVLGFIAFWIIARLIVYLLYKVGWVWLASPLDFLMSWVGL